MDKGDLHKKLLYAKLQYLELGTQIHRLEMKDRQPLMPHFNKLKKNYHEVMLQYLNQKENEPAQNGRSV